MDSELRHLLSTITWRLQWLTVVESSILLSSIYYRIRTLALPLGHFDQSSIASDAPTPSPPAMFLPTASRHIPRHTSHIELLSVIICRPPINAADIHGQLGLRTGRR